MGYVYATFSTWVTPTIHINRGDVWDDGDPVVQSHPDWFTDDPSPFVRRSNDAVNTAVVNPPKVERATADPGERRSISIPRLAGKAKSE